MINFLTRHPEKIYIPLLEHIELVFMTLLISVAIASVLTLLCMRSERLSMWLQQLLGVVYSIPLASPLRHPDPCDGARQNNSCDRADSL